VITRAFIVVVSFVVLMSCGQSPVAAPPSSKENPKPPAAKIDSLRKGVVYVPVLNVVRTSAYDSYSVLIGDSLYTCTKGYFVSGDTFKTTTHFLFDMGVEYLVDRLYFYPLEQDRFFACWQETNHRGIFTYFGTYTRGNNKAEWLQRFQAPTPGPPAIDSNAVYISTLGMVGKFNLSNGKPVWMHDSLFDQYTLSFKQFGRPLLYTNSVCFFDLPIKGRKLKSDSIWVNEASGKIRR
jgi:hypothetical protein